MLSKRVLHIVMVSIGLLVLCWLFPMWFNWAYFSYYNAKNEATHPHPTVSVLIPTYNRSDLLPRAIESILNQTVTDFELIIVDDGSVDNTAQILRKYIRQDDRIRVYFNHQNKGESYSRNRLIDLSRASYLAIMDSDDKSLPHRLKDEVDYLETHPKVAVVGGLAVFMGHPNQILPQISQKEHHIPIDLLSKCALSHSTVMMRKEYLNKHNLRYNEQMMANQDFDLWQRILLKNGTFGLVEKVVSEYYRHSSNSPEYYKEMNRSGDMLKNKMQSLIFNLEKQGENISYCRRLELMKEVNQKLKWLDEDAFEEIFIKDCSAVLDTLGYFYFVDENNRVVLSDYLLEDKQNNKVRCFLNGTPYSVVSKKNDVIVLDIPKVGHIKFKRDKNTWRVFNTDI